MWTFVIIASIFSICVIAVFLSAPSPPRRPAAGAYRAAEAPPRAAAYTPYKSYEKKPLLTATERRFYATLQELSSCGFTVVPQINLASVINKTSNGRWHNELFHNIDFGIFDEGFNILLLVELNDSSHNRPDRIERDFKVRDIAAAASIPFITFYTNKTKGFYVINSILDKLRLYRSDLPEYPWGREL